VSHNADVAARRKENDAIILVMQRLHVGDLAGHTAMKATELSDYSVGTVWGVRDLVRVRLDFPALKRKVIEVYERWA
jgi:hypothetical protein